MDDPNVTVIQHPGVPKITIYNDIDIDGEVTVIRQNQNMLIVNEGASADLLSALVKHSSMRKAG